MPASLGRYARLVEPRLIRIPRHLLHVGLDDLSGLAVPEQARAALRALLAELPIVPDATLSAQLVGPRVVSLPCLAVLARHVGQGLRDRNLSLMHDRARLRAERQKLLFLDADALAEVVAAGDSRPMREAILFVADAAPPVCEILATREAGGLASFVTATTPLRALSHWRHVALAP